MYEWNWNAAVQTIEKIVTRIETRLRPTEENVWQFYGDLLAYFLW